MNSLISKRTNKSFGSFGFLVYPYFAQWVTYFVKWTAQIINYYINRN